MKITLKSCLISFAIGLGLIAILFAGLKFDDFLESDVLLGSFFALIGIAYYFAKKFIPVKLAYLIGALVGTVVFCSVFLHFDKSTAFLAGLEYMIMLCVLITLLGFDAVILIVSAIVSVVRSSKNKTKAEGYDVASKTEKHIYPLVISFFIATTYLFLLVHADGFGTMLAVPLLGFVYFYFKQYCKMEWIYTLILAVPYVIGLVVARIIFLWVFYKVESILIISAVLTVLVIDVIATVIKKISEKRKLSTCKNE